MNQQKKNCETSRDLISKPTDCWSGIYEWVVSVLHAVHQLRGNHATSTFG